MLNAWDGNMKIPGFSMTLLELLTKKTTWAALATIVSTAAAAYEHTIAWTVALPVIFIAIGQICQRDATHAVSSPKVEEPAK